MLMQLKRYRMESCLLAAASFYFLSVDVLADAALAAHMPEVVFLWTRIAYLLAMAAGFLSGSFWERRLHLKLHRASRIVLSLSGTGLLLGIAYTENAPLLIVFVLISLYLAGLIGSFVYGRTTLSLRGCDCMGRLCALGMGLAAVLQIVVSFLALPLPLCALLLSAAMAASIYMLARERTANESLNGPVPDGWALPPLWLLLLGVAVISLMGGFNDGVLTSQQASGALNLYAAPRLFYFVGMALAGGIADRFRLSGLSILVLCVMVCSTAGALFMSSPATMALNAGLYSLFAGIVIIYFTVPFFQTADGKTPRSGPASGGRCGFPPWRWGLRAMSIF